MKSEQQRITVIIPTYNEKESIKPRVEELSRYLCNEDFEIVIVDDNSSDGTGEIAESLGKELPIRIIHRSAKLGLASAVATGLRTARGEIVGVMDADGSHPSSLGPELIRVVKEGTDIAVGSRYTRGGRIKNWPLQRKIMSKIAVILAKPLTKLKDPMSGYFFFKKSIIRKVNLKAKGYKILLDIMVRGNINKFYEVPYEFTDRQKGQSKIGLGVVCDYIYQLSQLYPLKLRRFMKYCIVGLSGVFINMFFLWFFTEILRLPYLIASPIAIELAIINNFSLNNCWTFKGNTNKSPVLIKLAKFNTISMGGLLVNMTILFMLTEFLQLYYLLSNLTAILAATLWNYLLNVSYTWQERSPSSTLSE